MEALRSICNWMWLKMSMKCWRKATGLAVCRWLCKRTSGVEILPVHGPQLGLNDPRQWMKFPSHREVLWLRREPGTSKAEICSQRKENWNLLHRTTELVDLSTLFQCKYTHLRAWRLPWKYCLEWVWIRIILSRVGFAIRCLFCEEFWPIR